MVDASVKVGVRVRPLSDVEQTDGCVSCLAYPSDPCQIMIGKDKLFSFDYIFNENVSQETLYAKTAAPMVDAVLQGYNATLFAYGQTGSGKTYSMGTCAMDDISDRQIGIVPRMVQDVFDRIPDLPFDYTVRVSFLEIYKEDVHDLLGEDANMPLPIREENNLIKIPGLTERLVTSSAEVINLLQHGAIKRSVGGTAMNRSSSRSHAVFTLHFVLQPKSSSSTDRASASHVDTEIDTDAKIPIDGDTLTSKLHLVDLAGSERQKKTHAEGDRLKEGININRGLLALGNVISALCEKDAKKRSHIPYRDSRLTRLLQDSLGGNSTTLMLSCVSPADSHMEETLNTLRYADRARMIKNKPILNRADPKDAELARLRSLVVQLQSRLKKDGVAAVGLMSPCPAKVQSVVGSQFSSTKLSEYMEKSSRLENEKRMLTDELDRLLEDNAETYRKLFDAEILRDALLTEVNELDVALNKFVPNLTDHSSEDLDNMLSEFRSVIDRLVSLRDGDQAKVVLDKLETAYDECKVNLSTDDVGEDVKPTLDLSSGIVAHDEPSAAPRGSDIRARRLAYKERMVNMEANLAQKRALLETLEQAASQGDESYANLLKQYEGQIQELESRISSLEEERSKLLTQQQHKTGDQSKDSKLETMERELSMARRQLTELSRLRKAKENRESECHRLRNEIQTLKVSMVKTAKQIKDDGLAYRKWRIEKEKEVRRLHEHDRRLQSELSKMSSVHERQQAVLKRRVEAAAATEKRLKEMLLLQRDRRNDKKPIDNPSAVGKHDFAARVRSWVSSDVDIQVGMGEARFHLHQLVDSRRGFCDQLRSTEAALSTETDQAKREILEAEISQLTNAIESQTQQMTELQQKLLDAGDRVAMDQSSASGGSTDQIISTRLLQLHNIQEARIALRYLFKEAVSAKIQSSIAEIHTNDLRMQISNNDDEKKELQARVVRYSASLDERSEQILALRQTCTSLEHERDALRQRVEEFRKKNEELKRSLKQQDHVYLLETTGQMRRLSGTPIFSRKRPVTRQSLQVLRKKYRNESPHILVPDSTKKLESVWDAFDEIQDLSDSSLLDPTWRLPNANETDHDTPNSTLQNHRAASNETTTRQSQAAIRCRCHGACTVRCSCHRAGQFCIPGKCKCIFGKCLNRPRTTPPHHSIQGKHTSLEPVVELMGPPLEPTVKRFKTPRVPLDPIQQQTVTDTENVMNQTFDLNTDNDGSPGSISIVGRTLWSKHRFSYFPSPSLVVDD